MRPTRLKSLVTITAAAFLVQFPGGASPQPAANEIILHFKEANTRHFTEQPQR